MYPIYTIRLLKPASRGLERLDKAVATRVVRRLRWLAENLESINPEHLKGPVQGLYKLREGDYRLAYEILRGERVIIVHLIGHRREIYKAKS
jgi:mRNA interferase RelE/StbE